MRAQHEILAKINELTVSINAASKHIPPKQNPLWSQFRLLVHKLSWQNAQEFLPDTEKNEERRTWWEKQNSCEKKILLEEMKELIDYAAMEFKNEDKFSCMNCCLILFSQLWLMGPSKDRVLTLLFQDYMRPHSLHKNFEPIFLAICNEYGIDWERLKLRYNKENKNGNSDTENKIIT